MKTFHIHCPPYNATIYFCITEKKCEARHYFIENFNVDVGDKPDSILGYCLRSDIFGPAIWLPKMPETPFDFGTLTHELYHAVNNILNSKGVTDLNEPLAYLLGYVVESFYTMYPPINKPTFSILGKKIWIK